MEKVFLEKPLLGRLWQLSLRHIPGVSVAGSASGVDYGALLISPENLVIPEPESVRSVCAALHWFSMWPGHIGRLTPFLADHDVEFNGFFFPHTPLYLARHAPSDRCLVDEDNLEGVVVFVEAVFIHGVTPLIGMNHSFFVVSAQIDKSFLNLLELSCSALV